MTQDFGQIDRKDPTSDLERMVESAAERAAEAVRVDGPKAQNRPIGSFARSLKDQHFDWQQGRMDSTFWAAHETQPASNLEVITLADGTTIWYNAERAALVEHDMRMKRRDEATSATEEWNDGER